MKNAQDFRRILERIDHKSYGSYKMLAGSYQWGDYILHVDHVQGDPFASPSRLSIEVPASGHHFPGTYYDRYHRRIALEDQVLRRFHRILKDIDISRTGSGKSGRITTAFPEQGVLPRMAVEFSEDRLLFRFEMGFPARGRTILAKEMEDLVFSALPGLAASALCYDHWDKKAVRDLKAAINLSDDQEAIRQLLPEMKLLSFVADGSILPRESGISDRPMKNAVAFTSPDSMRVTLNLPHAGEVTGMGIPEGITLITGGGYHGKSTLLKALERGVYNHIAGDGREYVITRDDAVKIQAEDGRSVKNTDISLFINHLPNGEDTRTFSSENASGSTSQAANVVEAFEAGSRLLMIDEDTSATNFMIRDRIMASLVPDEKEPISTLLKSIRALKKEKDVSFLIVVGSSGDYLAVADHVLMMDHYRVRDVTQSAREICARENVHPDCGPDRLPDIRLARELRPVRGGRMKLKASGRDSVIIDRETIDVRYLEQIAENGQTIGLAYLSAWILQKGKAGEKLILTIDQLYEIIRNEGLARVIPQGYPCGQPVLPRKQEVYACICRYRKAVMKQKRD